MLQWNPFKNPIANPLKSLTLLFVSWKLILLLVTFFSPGIGYDTSTTLFQIPGLEDDQGELRLLQLHHPLQASIVNKLSRWDAIYFVKIAQRGYLFEQEWAFGWGFTRFIGLLSYGLNWLGFDGIAHSEATIGIIVSHISHYLSVLVLFGISKSIFSRSNINSKGLAFTAACLHIISPAGIFLSAPYIESIFSFFSFAGYALYIDSTFKHESLKYLERDLEVVAAGLLFALSTLLRSNGTLNGAIFLYDATISGIQLLSSKNRLQTLRRLLVISFAGCIIGAVACFPQFLAYVEFCRPSGSRIWCQQMIPSIYTFVQRYYWDVGLFRYWKLPNLPLFLLAAPMITILSYSAFWAWRIDSGDGLKGRNDKESISNVFTDSTTDIFRRLAIPQFVLTVMALATYHVQIITRISSAYPLWYWWLALRITGEPGTAGAFGGKNVTRLVVQWMVLYALIQGGLFCSFLPPA